MKKWLFLVMFTLCLPAMVQAQTPVVTEINYVNSANVTFVWDYDFVASPSASGFNIYFRIVTNPTVAFTKVAFTGQVKTGTVAPFPEGDHYVYVTAMDNFGNESDQSEWIEVNKKTTKPGKPNKFNVPAPFRKVIP